METESLRATAAKTPLKPKSAWKAHGALIRAADEIDRLNASLSVQSDALAKAYRDVDKWKRAALLADERRDHLSTLSARVVDAAVERRSREVTFDEANANDAHPEIIAKCMDDFTRADEAYNAAVDALLAAKEGR